MVPLPPNTGRSLKLPLGIVMIAPTCPVPSTISAPAWRTQAAQVHAACEVLRCGSSRREQVLKMLQSLLRSSGEWTDVRTEGGTQGTFINSEVLSQCFYCISFFQASVYLHLPAWNVM